MERSLFVRSSLDQLLVADLVVADLE